MIVLKKLYIVKEQKQKIFAYQQKNKNMEDYNQNNSLFADFDLEEDVSEEENKKDTINIPKIKMQLLVQMAKNIKENNDRLLDLLSSYCTDEDISRINIGQLSDSKFDHESTDDEAGKIIEGVFDGESMIGPDGKQYSVPSNYASKSKLVEGDIMKLTITSDGTFVYKQIGPIDRKRIIGILNKTSDGNYTVEAEGRIWRVLNASVTYFKGNIGDEVVLLVPKIGDSKWGAVENIVNQAQ